MTDQLSINYNLEKKLSEVAFTGSYYDLEHVPRLFSGNYEDLTNKPKVPSKTLNLKDIENQKPNNRDILLYNSDIEKYVPTNANVLLTELDLSEKKLNDLKDVTIMGKTKEKYLKFSAGAWRPSNIKWSDVKDKPTGISAFINDANYLTELDFDNYVRKQDLVNIVMSSTDFEDFKKRIQDLL